ncbi:MAG: DMT family transporter [Deltaproteobacteria bacterium]|nr:DMT family transporter [Deltaproteobacteria bacterium]
MVETGVEVSQIAPSPARSRGIALIAAGAVLFAAMGAMAKLASSAIPTMELLASRSAVTLLAMELLRRRMGVPLHFARVPYLLSRTVAGFIGMACYFHSLRFIPLGEAVLLNNISPVLTSFAAVWLLGERLTAWKVGALAVSMLGLWLLVGARDLDSVQGQGALMGGASALAGAWAMISLKKAAIGNRSLMIVWALAAMSLTGSLTFADRDWLWPDGREGLLLLGTGLSAAAAQLLYTSGYRLLEASEASVYAFLTPVFATIAGGFVFGEWPQGYALGGGLLILGSGVASAWRQTRARP